MRLPQRPAGERPRTRKSRVRLRYMQHAPNSRTRVSSPPEPVVPNFAQPYPPPSASQLTPNAQGHDLTAERSLEIVNLVESYKEYLEAKLADVRKSCEYLATFAAATVYGTTQRQIIQNNPHPEIRKIIFACCGLAAVLALFGATSLLFESPTVRRLERTLVRRHWMRNGALLALLYAIGAMVFEYWNL
jgi:hypothetical protein